MPHFVALRVASNSNRMQESHTSPVNLRVSCSTWYRGTEECEIVFGRGPCEAQGLRVKCKRVRAKLRASCLSHTFSLSVCMFVLRVARSSVAVGGSLGPFLVRDARLLMRRMPKGPQDAAVPGRCSAQHALDKLDEAAARLCCP